MNMRLKNILKQLKSKKPKLPVLMLSVHPEEQYAVRTLKAGASGYLTKGSATDELIAAIRKISTGKKYVSSSLAEKLAFDLDLRGPVLLTCHGSSSSWILSRYISVRSPLSGPEPLICFVLSFISKTYL